MHEMRSIRVIARLDVKGSNVVKGVQFEALRVIGKPGEVAEMYYKQGADELVYIDIVASLYRRENLLHIVKEASKSIFIPFTVGGGVRSLEDIHDLLQAGAEKVAINTAATKRPELLKEAAERFGAQCVVLSIEAKRTGNGWQAFTDNGREPTGLDVIEWAKRGQELGAGEILLTSVDREGTQKGLEKELIQAVSSAVSIPVIAAGGASSPENIADVMAASDADAVAVGSLLHYGKTTISEIKDAVFAKKVSVRRATEAERAFKHAPAKEVDVTDYNKFTLKQFEQNGNVSESADDLQTRAASEADVTVIDYGINNVRSVVKAIQSFGTSVAIAKTVEEMRGSRRLLLPGVGAFPDGIAALKERGFIEPVREAIRNNIPFLGICLGLQLLFSESEEFGAHEGLDSIKGKVVSFPDPKTANIPGYKLPHIAWTSIREPIHGRWKDSIFASTEPQEKVYFVHSFYPVPEDPKDILAIATYGGVDFCAAIQRGSVTATQFHLEKSGAAGLGMLRAFCET